jgi:hypothetical protein
MALTGNTGYLMVMKRMSKGKIGTAASWDPFGHLPDLPDALIEIRADGGH